MHPGRSDYVDSGINAFHVSGFHEECSSEYAFMYRPDNRYISADRLLLYLSTPIGTRLFLKIKEENQGYRLRRFKMTRFKKNKYDVQIS